jgi:hypothetical protein
VLESGDFVITVWDVTGQTWIARAPLETFTSLDNALMIEGAKSLNLHTALNFDGRLERLIFEYNSCRILEIFLKRELKLPKANLLATSYFVGLMQPTIDYCNNFVLAQYIRHQPRKFPRPPTPATALQYLTNESYDFMI